jgi:hypothetical protein
MARRRYPLHDILLAHAIALVGSFLIAALLF